jgi:hypothetical protein
MGAWQAATLALVVLAGGGCNARTQQEAAADTPQLSAGEQQAVGRSVSVVREARAVAGRDLETAAPQ